MRDPETFRDAILYFADYQICHDFLVRLRWPDGKVKCSECGADKLCYLAKNRVWKCYVQHARRRFSLKTGTIFADSPIGFEKWLPAAWMLLNGRDSASSGELARALGVSQKTAWFMQHRIGLAMQSRVFSAASHETRPLPVTTKPFDDTPEFRRFRAGMAKLLKIAKEELDRRVIEAKLVSDRIYDPDTPGRKRKLR